MKKLNEKMATILVKYVSTVWFFYFCVILVTAPLYFTGILTIAQYISSAIIQLLMLPLLAISSDKQVKHTENILTKIEKIEKHILKDVEHQK
jgi:hypothetical protein